MSFPKHWTVIVKCRKFHQHFVRHNNRMVFFAESCFKDGSDTVRSATFIPDWSLLDWFITMCGSNYWFSALDIDGRWFGPKEYAVRTDNSANGKPDSNYKFYPKYADRKYLKYFRPVLHSSCCLPMPQNCISRDFSPGL